MITLALTNYNRFELLLRSFSHFLGDPRVTEIVISDDKSDPMIYYKLKTYVENDSTRKIKLFKNEKNVGVYVNKKLSVARSTNEWVIIGDSDNIYYKDYLDKIFEQQWEPHTIFAPDFAKPNFSYQTFSDMTVNKGNVASLMDQPMFSTMLNTFNFFVNRKEYLKIWDPSIEPVTFDSLYFNYCWLKAGNNIKVVKGLQYDHTVHDGSHFQNNVHRSGNLMNEIEAKIKSLK